jgi:hypothetical protein
MRRGVRGDPSRRIQNSPGHNRRAQSKFLADPIPDNRSSRVESVWYIASATCRAVRSARQWATRVGPCQAARTATLQAIMNARSFPPGGIQTPDVGKPALVLQDERHL